MTLKSLSDARAYFHNAVETCLKTGGLMNIIPSIKLANKLAKERPFMTMKIVTTPHA
jgi:hypothetical protein